MDNVITVLIPFYNPGKYIVDAINSIYAQTYKSWKIILVDDGSTDNSPNLIKPYLFDPRITYIRHPSNSGQSMSLNTGLSYVETAFFVQLDPDDWFYPNTLEKLVSETLKQPADVAVISGNINISFEDENGQVLKSYIKKGRHFSNPYDFMLANSAIWPRCYRTSIVKGIGGWLTDDPYGGRYVEDMRMLYRLIPTFRFYWIDELMLYHRRHLNNNTNALTETAEALKWTIEDTLKKWGDNYVPVFQDKEGYRILTGFEVKQKL